MSTELLDALKVVGGGSVASLLFFFLYGGYKTNPWWIFAHYHEKIVALLQSTIVELRDQIKELKAENRELRSLARQAADAAETIGKTRAKETTT